jgi:adenylate cyclase
MLVVAYKIISFDNVRNQQGDYVSEVGPEGVKPPLEIERKYLVAELPYNLEGYPAEQIRQGYIVIGTDGSEVRLRDRQGSFTLTVKSKGDLSRGEWEVPATAEQFDTLWPTTEGKRVEKTRFSIPYNDATIELDVFEGDLQGLVTAEVEFPSELAAELFEAPDWFGDEVTTNSAYKNQSLALNGHA